MGPAVGDRLDKEMKRRTTFGALAVSVTVLLFCVNATAQVKMDVTSEDARKAAGQVYLDDLAVHDTALIYQNFCIKDGGLYVPGWTNPADLADTSWASTGIILRIEILPAKKIKGVWVDAAKAQHVAQGNTTASSTLNKEDYNKAVRDAVNRLFVGGDFGVNSCDDEQRQNPLRPMSLFSVESINGFTRISELLASVRSKADK
jgi:hypothetical protein